MNFTHDVIVIGGGLVGLGFATLLAKQTSLSIAVIDRNPPRWITASEYDLRTSAISLASERLFKALDLWKVIQRVRFGVYRNMHVWDAEGYADIQFTAASMGLPHLGHIIENRVMHQALWKLATEQPNLTLRYGRLVHLESTPSHVDLILKDTDQEVVQNLRARVMVGADGGASWVRRALQMDSETWPYQQSALVATVETQKPHQETAWQRFQSDGPLAFLPLQEPHLCSIVWSSSNTWIQSMLQASETDFNRELTRQFVGKLGTVTLCGPRAKFPLTRSHVDRYVHGRVAMMGDAAHVIHPLAGQGVNLGFLDAVALVAVLKEACQKDWDLGHTMVLRRYERERKGHNHQVQRAMDGFYQLFGSRNPGVKMLRNGGLQIADRLNILKKHCILQASGLEDLFPEALNSSTLNTHLSSGEGQ